MLLSMATSAAKASAECWLNASLIDCLEKGAEFVALEVRHSNLSAIKLYRQLGFVETGRRKRYYENGEDALLMEYIFKSGEVDCNAV